MCVRELVLERESAREFTLRARARAHTQRLAFQLAFSSYLSFTAVSCLPPCLASLLPHLLPFSLICLQSPPCSPCSRMCVCARGDTRTHTGFLVQVFALSQLVLKALHISRPFRTLGFFARQNALRVRVLRGHCLQLLHSSRTQVQTQVRGECLLYSSFTLSSSA